MMRKLLPILALLLLSLRPSLSKTELYVNPLFWGKYDDAEIYRSEIGFKHATYPLAFGAYIKAEEAGDYNRHGTGAYIKTKYEPYYTGLCYKYDSGRDEYIYTADFGYLFCRFFNASAGYAASFVNEKKTDLAAVKFNFPVTKHLSYKYHIRSAFTSERQYEWWQEAQYAIEINKHMDVKLRYQMDRELGTTEREGECIFVVKWGK